MFLVVHVEHICMWCMNSHIFHFGGSWMVTHIFIIVHVYIHLLSGTYVCMWCMYVSMYIYIIYICDIWGISRGINQIFRMHVCSLTCCISSHSPFGYVVMMKHHVDDVAWNTSDVIP